jgi:arylsulfatase A-like enzyme
MRTSRNQFLVPVAVALAFACTALGTTAVCRAADRPNFVFLISEDNSTHFMKLFNETGPSTPNIEKLAAHGLIFDRAFSNAPVCSVARSTLVTSCYAPRIGTQFHRREKPVPMPDGTQMFPAYLRQAGYYTTNNKKEDYNAIKTKDVWDESSGNADWHQRKPGQPFFHQQSSYNVTHESSLHFPASAMETPTETDPASVSLAPIHPDTPTFRYTYARYHDCVRQMDRQVGEMVDRLAGEGLLEDTFVFYFGDHGGVLPGSKGYIWERGLHVPMVVRVPENWKHLVDAEIGTRVKGFVNFIDMGPTLLHLAGLGVPMGFDGRPFLGKGVTTNEVNSRDETFGYADRFDEKYDLVRTLRKGNLKYLRSYQPFNFDGLQNDYRYKMLAYEEWRDLYKAGKLNALQSRFFEPRPAEALFDLENDPEETKNLAGDPKYADALADMRGRLTRWVKGMPDLSFIPESVLVDEGFDNPVAYGQVHKDQIARLVDVADLSLVPFGDARPGIGKALASQDPWQRYWGLIVCSSHGKAAESFVATAKELADDDPELLVRVRAAEFLGLIGVADPRPTIAGALLESKSPVQANLILNTAVLLQDGKPGYRFDLPRGKIVGDQPGDQVRYVTARLDYLAE